MILGRTDLRIGVSGPKFDAEVDFEFHMAAALQKSPKIAKNWIFDKKIVKFCFLVLKDETLGIV